MPDYELEITALRSATPVWIVDGPPARLTGLGVGEGRSPPTATSPGCGWNGSYGPKADSCTAAKGNLFDHCVGCRK